MEDTVLELTLDMQIPNIGDYIYVTKEDGSKVEGSIDKITIKNVKMLFTSYTEVEFVFTSRNHGCFDVRTTDKEMRGGALVRTRPGVWDFKKTEGFGHGR